MQAIVIKKFGGPEVLAVEDRSMPDAKAGHVLIEVKAFGVNHAEIYFRQGAWKDAAEISGIECVGVVKADPSGRLPVGQKVLAIVGGMGRSINGSYAQYTLVPASNVAAVTTDLPWETLAAIPESYATAWSCLFGVLDLKAGQSLLIRGATSALGQAALSLAAHHGALVTATTRQEQRRTGLQSMGAQQTWLETPNLHETARDAHQVAFDAVLDLVGNTTVLGSLAMAKRGGKVCLAGFLGGGGPIANLEPVFQIPSGRFLSVFASALVTGGPEFPLAEIPFQDIVDGVAKGHYKAEPVRVFGFADIGKAHQLMESGQANGKLVVRVQT